MAPESRVELRNNPRHARKFSMFSCISSILLILTLQALGEAASPPLSAFFAAMEPIKYQTELNDPLVNHVYRSKNRQTSRAIIFMPGMGEPAIKYHSLIHDLKDLEASFYYWDHIGQGFSTHLLPQTPEKTHIHDFDVHVMRLQKFIEQLKKNHSQVFVITHSMGGHIALRILQNNPQLIDRLVTTAPMIDIQRYSISLKVIDWVLSWFDSTRYMLGASFKKQTSTNHSLLSHSQERLHEYKELQTTYPEVLRRWVTVGWLRAAIASIQKLNEHEKLPIAQPILILKADQEYLVSSAQQDEFCRRQLKCQTLTVPDSYHEILIESDPARQFAIDAIRSFINSK